MSVKVLMVAEKPSISNSISHILSHGQSQSRRGVANMCPVHEFNGKFQNKNAHFIVTSVVGHVYTTDFPPEYQSWDKTEPIALFDAETRKVESDSKNRICKHLSSEAKGVDYLVLWLDCDREGENICFEVIENTEPYMSRVSGQQIFRAKFSSITAPDILKAMATLGAPNENEARSVDARQILDLKVGVAFTRFQTKYFTGKYGNLDAALVSYGPCQTPTLGFCVHRHDQIQTFQPENFWRVVPTVSKGHSSIVLEWDRGRMFDQGVAVTFKTLVEENTRAVVEHVTAKEERRPKPEPLNTVNLLKIASSQLGIGPHHTMQVAERLYLQGYITYPRTESTAYSPHFDLAGTVKEHRNHPLWGDYASTLLQNGLSTPKAGHDAGDHPPITPTRAATESELGSDNWRIYDYVTRHFLASVSPSCRYMKTTAKLSIGGETFTVTGKTVKLAGYTRIMPWTEKDDKPLPELVTGEPLPITSVELKAGQTSPPDNLSESELISLMEKHGIGTDASMATHINNICERNFVKVEGTARRLVPTLLGIALVHGYHKIDPELVLPTVRSNIEQQVDLIAKGKAAFEAVVTHAIQNFKRKFEYFVRKIESMDVLFEATFSPLAATGRVLSRCGKCRRMMKYIDLRPARLHCATCDETYKLPANGTIKLYKELKCPLDDFELVLFSTGSNGKSYSLCPYCYNFPPFEGVTKMGCNECTHPTCKHSLTKNGVTPCVECSGTLVLDASSGPKWKLDCNKCNFQVKLVENAHKISTTDQYCEDCASMLLKVDFNKKDTPLENGETEYTGCFQCDEFLNDFCQARHGKMIHDKFRRRRGGGRRGRGGRGRGRGRGGKNVDPRMTFDGF
eukprot:GILK01005805.1.p1 GENE.GILK01005805.1~~GILK01005805.1.p1  ORF type:complete len:853 (+),score=115.47 GILK01005805.1:50-2608(+)